MSIEEVVNEHLGQTLQVTIEGRLQNPTVQLRTTNVVSGELIGFTKSQERLAIKLGTILKVKDSNGAELYSIY